MTFLDLTACCPATGCHRHPDACDEHRACEWHSDRVATRRLDELHLCDECHAELTAADQREVA